MITENAKGAQRSYSLQVYVQMTDEGMPSFWSTWLADVRTKFLSINPKEGETRCGSICLRWGGAENRLPYDRRFLHGHRLHL